MELVDNWRKQYKAYSVWALGASGAIFSLLGSWEKLPIEARSAIESLVPVEYLPWLGTALTILGVIGKLLKQTALAIPFDEEPTRPTPGASANLPSELPSESKP